MGSKKKQGSAKRKSAGAGARAKAKAVDVVTGKTKIEYFFDPTLLLKGKNGNDFAARVQKGQEDSSFFESKHLFMPCTIIKRLDDEENGNAKLDGKPHPGPTLVKTSDGTLHKISDSTKLIPLHAPDDYMGCEDVLYMSQITEASLLNTLRTRYRRDDIYTSAGPILISVNPYRSLDTSSGTSIYSEEQMLVYRNKNDFEETAPHLFQVADRAYTALMDSVHNTSRPDDEDPLLTMENHLPPGSVRNQSIIISGESGAGKTEATKIIMKYLARITRRAASTPKKGASDGEAGAALEDRVLSSNPLLETFGNAQTLRNDNSSRFGKFIHIYFDCNNGAITGASISNYLLEKTRITHQVEGERNYHVFYQMLAGAGESVLQDLGLDVGMSNFFYLGNRSAAGQIEKDAKAFEETVQCLESIGLTEEERAGVFRIAAAVLHLGNVQFEDGGNDETGTQDSKISEGSRPSLTQACSLLGLNEEKLSEALLTKTLIIGGKSIKKQQNVAMAEDKRDALAKMTYACLFLWLVRRVNENLENAADGKLRADDKTGFIGVLDIYGFECFEVNGYEQLLINYCNEKLQRHFNRHLFEVEQQLYAVEGVDWSYISFNDNRPCLELIEGASNMVGILNALDDAWGGMGTASEKDGKFVTQLHKLFGKVGSDGSRKEEDESASGHKNYITPKFGKDKQFVIVHYAGNVRYTADGFVEKNMDTMSNELRELGDDSAAELPKLVYAVASPASASGRSSIRGVSVGSQFRSSLQALVVDLERTQPHYIRCVKPNLTKSPSSFMSGEVLKQLRYSGMMEAIRIRREGYALREEHESFYNRFSVLLSSGDIQGDEPGIVQLVKVLSKRLHVTEADWQIGHSKIFLRRELADKLERFAKLRVHRAARTLSRFGKRTAHRRLAGLLVPWARFRLHMREYYRLQLASTRIAAAVRRVKQERIYRTVLRAVIKLQAPVRRRLAYQRVRKIRDPFIDMSFKECQKLLKSEQSRLDEAVKSQNFRRAALLETRVKSVQDAVERKRPLTRAVLEERIAVVEKDLDDALERKAFTECEPLQDKLNELKAKRASLPTVEELIEAVTEAESAISVAVKSKDFAGAADGQARLEEARRRLDEATAAEEGSQSDDSKEEADKGSVFGFESRAELEQEIREISDQIQQAVDAKNFNKATSLQKLLDDRERLRTHFPSVNELEQDLAKAKEELEAAVSRKDFAAADKLNKKVADLEKRCEQERKTAGRSAGESSNNTVTVCGEEKTIETRAELEEWIVSLNAEVSAAVAAKEFKKADEIHSGVDRLVALRASFPTMAEMSTQLDTLKRDMNAAIGAKQFAKAEELNGSIEKLEVKLEKEKTKAALTKRPVDVASVKTTPVAPAHTRKVSMSASVKSASSAPVHPVSGPPTEVGASSESTKPVRKLRPAKPVTSAGTDTIVSVAKLLVSKRANAAVILDGFGHVAGIVTDTDFTRRVAAKDIDPATTPVSEVMTAHPTCVSMADSAMGALTIMIENHFRHLPVVDNDRSVVGLLDISKCLNEAITKLEATEDQATQTSEEALKQVVAQRAASSGQAEVLHALLGNLMSKAFGSQAIPTLRSLLQHKPQTVVAPTATLREAASVMAEHRHAALVVDDSGALVGIVGFRDMMSRVIAKELALETNTVCDIMTPNPQAVSSDMSVLDALHTMFDHKFLTLPVCEEDGRIVGVVDVMDVMYGCGGTDGWRSIFSSAMDVDDDVSDVSSSTGFPPAKLAKALATSPSEKEALQAVTESVEERPVSKLRPSKPIVASTEDSILRTVKMIAAKRAAASILVNQSGVLSGILTDKDVTRRVVAKHVDPSNTPVSQVMTPDPMCVSMDDAAMEALTIMVENRFRYLPVVDEDGAIAGLLDIAKCMASVIRKLERAQEKTSAVAAEAVQQVVSQQGASGAQAAALQALLGDLMSQAMGGTAVPTLRSILPGKPSTIVSPRTSVREAGQLMAEHVHAALVVDESGSLVGLFSFKDMLSRCVARERNLDISVVAEVMTPEPETASPDITVLEALQIMSDHKFLTLPVCEDDGEVLGVVDVIDVIYGCGGSEGWRSVVNSAMEVSDDQTSASGLSGAEASHYTGGASRLPKKEKTVEKLRPSKPNLSLTHESILSVAKFLQRKRSDASLVVQPEGSLAGIITDTDVTRRVVAKNLDPASVSVSEVMTSNPTCVSTLDPAMDALTLMVENHFRHLPVVDEEGSVVGLLDIGRCLNDAIAALERESGKGRNSAQDMVKQMVSQQGVAGAQAAAIQSMLGDIVSKAMGDKDLPTLRSFLKGKPSTIVSPVTTIRETGMLMAESRHAALVVENGTLVGIFGFKDMMSRAIANELDLDTTNVMEVMTPEPESVSPDITVLDALQTMYDNKFLTLPVCEDSGDVVGLVDVMDVIYGCGGTDGWRSIFSSAMELDYDGGDSVSAGSRSARKPMGPRSNFPNPNAVPSTLEFDGGDDGHSYAGSTLGEDRRSRSLVPASVVSGPLDPDTGVFKVTDPSGNTHRIRCRAKIDVLLQAVSAKAGIARRVLRIQYVDDEGDAVVMTSDDDVLEAWHLAQRSGEKYAKLTAVEDTSKAWHQDPPLIAAILAGSTILLGAAIILARRRDI